MRAARLAQHGCVRARIGLALCNTVVCARAPQIYIRTCVATSVTRSLHSTAYVLQSDENLEGLLRNYVGTYQSQRAVYIFDRMKKEGAVPPVPLWAELINLLNFNDKLVRRSLLEHPNPTSGRLRCPCT